MKVMDIKPRPTTNLEHFDAWRNHTQSRFVEINGKRIEVIKVDTSALGNAARNICKAYSHYPTCICVNKESIEKDRKTYDSTDNRSQGE